MTDLRQFLAMLAKAGIKPEVAPATDGSSIVILSTWNVVDEASTSIGGDWNARCEIVFAADGALLEIKVEGGCHEN